MTTSISYSLIEFYFIVTVASIAQHRFINFDNYRSEGCKNSVKSDHYDPVTGCQSRLSWAGNSRNIDFSNFSYLDPSYLVTWKKKIFLGTEESQKDETICNFINMMLKPPCVSAPSEDYPENKYAIAPPCRSYCKAAEAKYMSQLKNF